MIVNLSAFKTKEVHDKAVAEDSPAILKLKKYPPRRDLVRKAAWKGCLLYLGHLEHGTQIP